MRGYIGHTSQICGVEEHRLVGGKGDGLRIYEVTNGKGLQLTISPDRAGDITRLKYKGINMSYMSPCGYVVPSYYESEGTGWLKSFTAGFLTTCGLQSVGSPCIDNGEELPLHGSISNLPSEHCYWNEDDLKIEVNLIIRDEVIFGRKLVLKRKIIVSKLENTFTIIDEIQNTGDRIEPVEILYHMNMGYPLLDEDSIVEIKSIEIIPRDDHAKADIDNCLKMEKPQEGYRERCYYHKFDNNKGVASIFQPKLGVGLEMKFDTNKLNGFVEWKMMGYRDYVLGLECGNCLPDGRDIMREKGMLKYLNTMEKVEYIVNIEMLDK